VGFGGSVGLESPVVVTGSSIGSNLGRLFGMNYKSIITLIGCGAAGAIAGIFKAPVAGVVFALEVLMLDISMWSISILISAVTGASISYLFWKGSYTALSHSGTFFSEYTPACSADPRFAFILQITTDIESAPKEKTWITSCRWRCLGVVLIFLLLRRGDIPRTSFWKVYCNRRGRVLAGDNLWVFLLFVICFCSNAMTVTTGLGGIFAPTMFMADLQVILLPAV
jgi:CIC family chloride channel protein